MEFIELSKENYKDYLPLDIAAFSFAFPGAMGAGGDVVIITTDGQLYCFNYVYQEFSKDDVDAILPILSQCDLPIFGERDRVPEGWRYISLGGGHNLLIQNQYVKPFFKMHKEYAKTVDEIDGCLYRSWLKIMVKLLKHYTLRIMSSNSFLARRQRLVSVFEDTMDYIEHSQECLDAISYSIQNQKFIPQEKTIELPLPKYDTPAQIRISQLRSFEAAAQYQGQHVAVLNFASATTPGGGVEKGASAQEEALCRVSTLYPCLKDRKMWKCFYASHRSSCDALHNDDVIYTPKVLVLKDDDFNILNNPFFVDVITCAAPNLREKPSNSYNQDDGCRAIISDEDLLALHEQRAKKILAAAVNNEADVLVLGAFGCGAFRNNPYVVAQAYRNILPLFRNYFKVIEFAVYCRADDLSNFQAFSTIL